jgi:phenol 2-monooxygenase (NADPH)
MSRTSREIHYPQSVDTLDPYVLLVHQGMIEEVFLEDLKTRGVKVNRSSAFVKCSGRDSNNVIESTYEDVITGERKIIQSQYVIGCDGAHSQVRKSMPGVIMSGQSGNAAWGVLDGE